MTAEVGAHHLDTTPRSPSKVRGTPIPSQLERLVLDCLAKDRNDRPQTADAFIEGLAQIDADDWDDADAQRWLEDHAARFAPCRGEGANRPVGWIEPRR